MRKRAEEKQNICDAPTEGKRTARTRAKRQTKDGLDKLLLKYPTVDDVGGMILQNSCETVAVARKMLKPEECTVSLTDIATLTDHFITTDTKNHSVIADYEGIRTLIINTAINRVVLTGTRLSYIDARITGYMQPLAVALLPFSLSNQLNENDKRYTDICNFYTSLLETKLAEDHTYMAAIMHEVYVIDAVIKRLGEYTDLPLNLFTNFLTADAHNLVNRVKDIANKLLELISDYRKEYKKGAIKISSKGLKNLKALAEWDINSDITITDADIDRDLENNTNLTSLMTVRKKRYKA